jgi:hypothetical protein
MRSKAEMLRIALGFLFCVVLAGYCAYQLSCWYLTGELLVSFSYRGAATQYRHLTYDLDPINLVAAILLYLLMLGFGGIGGVACLKAWRTMLRAN